MALQPPPWEWNASLKDSLTRWRFGSERLLGISQRLEGDAPEAGLAAAMEEFFRATKTFRAVLLLAGDGHGQQALILTRSLFESAMVTIWAATHPNEADDLAELHALYGAEQSRRERLTIGVWPDTPAEPLIDTLQEAKARHIYGDRANGLWTGHPSLEALVDELACANGNDFISTAYRHMSAILMSDGIALGTATGLASRSMRYPVPDNEAGSGILFGASDQQVENALFLSSSAYQWALAVIIDSTAPQLGGELRDACGLLWLATKDASALSQLNDDAPCPCNREGATWESCHKWTQSLGTVNYRRVNTLQAKALPVKADADSGVQPEEAGSTLRLAESEPPEPTGPVVFTFTCRLPFTLGLTDDGALVNYLQLRFADPNDMAHYGETPWVRLRPCNIHTEGYGFWPAHDEEVLERLYGHKPTEARPAVGARAETYEQWVSLETPGGRLEGESPDDAAYAFHRCLRLLESFLDAHNLVVNHLRVHPVTTQELGPLVLRGAYVGDEWMPLTHLLMHPEAQPLPLKIDDFSSKHDELSAALEMRRQGHPFLVARMWHQRALRSHRYRGDVPDLVVSLQTAAESLIYDLWVMLLVDKGKQNSVILKTVNAETPYKSILVKVLPTLIGGSWDVTLENTPIGDYWRSLYELRNRIVHNGHVPSSDDGEAALIAYDRLIEYIRGLLWRRSASYPRTLLALVGVPGMERREWMTSAMRASIQRLVAEPLPWHWPADVAGRSRGAHR